MAISDSGKSLSEDYLLEKKEEKVDTSKKTDDASDVKSPVDAVPEAVVNVIPEEPSVTSTERDESPPAPEEIVGESAAATVENDEAAPTTGEDVTEATQAASEESTETGNQETTDDQEAVEETEEPEIKLETAPADYRFPTTNQSRHCFTRYIEYHRCIAAKGEDAPECNKFAKYYRSLCPGEWVDRWNEQRENGTFPGPL